ncbi:MAG: inositol monophosphatase family protein [Patescibacteria group bacterium]|nr:inositol monophosphatase family protein [Patescibacteria group bacterium]
MKTQTENRIEKFIKTTLPKAGEILRKKFKKVGVKYTKRHALDVVTEADLAANRLLLIAIKKTFPDHGIISEETAEYKNGSEYIWVIDPLDGTLNFSRGIPIFVTMLAVFRNKELIMSAI